MPENVCQVANHNLNHSAPSLVQVSAGTLELEQMHVAIDLNDGNRARKGRMV